jgi:hypothetical protein
MEELKIGSEFNVHSSSRILAKIFFSVHQRALAGMLFMCTNSIMKVMIFLKSYLGLEQRVRNDAAS